MPLLLLCPSSHPSSRLWLRRSTHPFHTGAILASALDCLTLPVRLFQGEAGRGGSGEGQTVVSDRQWETASDVWLPIQGALSGWPTPLCAPQPPPNTSTPLLSSPLRLPPHAPGPGPRRRQPALSGPATEGQRRLQPGRSNHVPALPGGEGICGVGVGLCLLAGRLFVDVHHSFASSLFRFRRTFSRCKLQGTPASQRRSTLMWRPRRRPGAAAARGASLMSRCRAGGGWGCPKQRTQGSGCGPRWCPSPCTLL